MGRQPGAKRLHQSQLGTHFVDYAKIHRLSRVEMGEGETLCPKAW